MSTNKYTEQGITYDYNGNIKSLKRYGGMGNLEDDFTYNYSGNKLLNINTGTSFVYDANGNMTKDGRRNLEFEYNSLNLLSKVKVGSTINAVYCWGVDGSKRSVTDGSGLNGFEYLGSMVYKRQNGILSLESAPFDGGRILKTLSGYDVFRYTTDHLGSVRVISSQIGQVVFRGDYYPFGESYSTIGMSSAFTRDKFNGKELQTTGSVGLLDYGARMYDTRLGRWLTLDPKSESYYSKSPYTYCLNNPLNAIDPDGKLVIFINGYTREKALQANLGYWNGFDKAVMKHLNDNRVIYRHGGNNINPLSRYSSGYQQATFDAQRIVESITNENGNVNESIKIITHSMGAAYGKGYTKALKKHLEDNGYKNALITLVADFDPFQAKSLNAEQGTFTQQFTHRKIGLGEYSWIANQRQNKLPDHSYYNSENEGSHFIKSFIKNISNLKEGTYIWDGKSWMLKNN